MAITVFCENHPEVETKLHCSQCSKPVCVNCMVHARVGIRCDDCGKARPSPEYNVSRPLLARSIVATCSTGLITGIFLTALILPLFNNSLFIYIILWAGIGYVQSEVANWASKHKRGRPLQYAAGIGITLVFFTKILLGTQLNIADLLGVGIAIYIAYLRLR